MDRKWKGRCHWWIPNSYKTLDEGGNRLGHPLGLELGLGQKLF